MIKNLDSYPVNKVIPWCCEEFAQNVAFDQDYGERKTTYSELLLIIKKLSAHIYALGLKGENVALVGKNSCDFAMLLLGALCSDLTLIPIDPTLNEADTWERIGLCDAKTLICDSEAAAKLGDRKDTDVNILLLSEVMEDALSKEIPDSDMELCDVAEDHVSLMLFSSGTGGRIKLAKLTNMNLTTEWNVVKNYDRVMDRALIISPLFHTLGLTDLMGNIFTGRCIYLSGGFAHILREIKYVRPKCMRMVPASADWIAQLIKGRSTEEAKDLLGGNLRNIRTSGAPLDARIRDELAGFGINTVSDYGMTEATGPVAVAVPVGEDLVIPEGSVGKVIDGLTVTIKKAPGNEDGEIVLSGGGIFKGYYKDEEATNQSLKDGSFYTGDIGRLDDEGYLHIVGRSKNVIILSTGENVIPETVEKELLKEELIHECIVYEEDGALAAKIVERKRSEESRDAIHRSIREYNRSNPIYLQIRHVHFVDMLEKTGSGKVKR